jgi:cytoskeletal protein RodZ
MRTNTTERARTSLNKILMVFLGIIVIAIISGCSDNNTNAKNATNSTNATSSDNNKTNEVLHTDFSSEAVVSVQPTDGGTAIGDATITYNEETKVMSVEVKVAGLKPDSEHVQHIHSGTCKEYGDAIYSLDNLKANADGEASTTNTFQDVEKFDVANMILNIHQGSDLEGDNAKQISCGVVMASE